MGLLWLYYYYMVGKQESKYVMFYSCIERIMEMPNVTFLSIPHDFIPAFLRWADVQTLHFLTLVIALCISSKNSALDFDDYLPT